MDDDGGICHYDDIVWPHLEALTLHEISLRSYNKAKDIY